MSGFVTEFDALNDRVVAEHFECIVDYIQCEYEAQQWLPHEVRAPWVIANTGAAAIGRGLAQRWVQDGLARPQAFSLVDKTKYT